MRRVLAALAAVAVGGALLLIECSFPGTHTAPAATPPVRFVGSAACKFCHAREHAALQGTQHARAMQVANGVTVAGDFNDARFTRAGVTSTFFRRDGKFFVSTDGADGRLADFQVQYTIGVVPLQQYLIAFPGGRLQALGVAWDSRPKAQGGQRWFHLYPDRKLKAGDPLHWTGIDQNWNYQCADCHATNLRKGYDASTGAFTTTWSEPSVGCEACHGPASNHVAWAKRKSGWQAFEASKGLTVALDERRNVAWTIDAATGNGRRSTPRASNLEIEVCARCHARRSQFSDDTWAGMPQHDAFQPALLEPTLYYADGQQRGEVYTHGSFLQSRMFAKGVTCADCHDPHTQQLRAKGNALCASCHSAAKYDGAAHHHHAAESKGAQCIACHMPATTYMLIDARHDHSMRIPRPDRSVALGTPNACNGCHAGRTAQWAASAIARWSSQPRPGFQRFAEAFHAAQTGAPGAQRMLTETVADRTLPALVRASAIARLGSFLGPTTIQTVANALKDADPDVRAAAVRVLAGSAATTRLRVLPRMLADASRVVRMQTARALVGETEALLPAASRARFESALAEYFAAQRFDADRPESHANLASVQLARGELEKAAAELRKALALDPTFAAAAINFAELYRAQGREHDAETVLRSLLAADPGVAVARHVLGLALVRQRRMPEALAALREAARRAPEEARFAYVYGVTLHDTGARAEAMRVLAAGLVRHPYDREILFGLASFELEAGDRHKAVAHARLLRDLEPDNQDFGGFAAAIPPPP